MRIVKDTIKRLPSALIERWCVQKYCDGFLQYGQAEKVGRMLYCNNGTWDQLITVSDDYVKAFMMGGPIGFSCDIANLPQHYKDFWRTAIAEFKKDREIYAQGTARVLVDNDGIIVIEYADKQLRKCIIQVFAQRTHTTDMIVYPVVDVTAGYIWNGESLKGVEIKENGITVDGIMENSCVIIYLIKV